MRAARHCVMHLEHILIGVLYWLSFPCPFEPMCQSFIWGQSFNASIARILSTEPVLLAEYGIQIICPMLHAETVLLQPAVYQMHSLSSSWPLPTL